MSGLSQKPEFSTPLQYPVKYKDPVTGLIIPKRREENEMWREKLLREAEIDPILRKDLLAASKESIYFWINAFCWTYHQFDIDPKTHEPIPAEIVDWPFVTWPVQDDVLKELELGYKEGKGRLVDKTRDMGASWICLAFIHHKWLFESGCEIREMSRNERLVDGNSDSLLWKHDYINKWLPEWMRPPGVMMRGRGSRTKLEIKNMLNGSTIAGEATTSVALSGGRCKILFLDEFAKVQNGQEIRSATRDVTPFRIVNSTPFGAGTEYSRWKKSGQIKVLPLMFYNHPEKGRDRYITEDELGHYHIRSPWFNAEEKVRSPKEMAQEVLAEDIEAGDTTFTIPNIDKHIALFAKKPKCRLNVILKKDIPDSKVSKEIYKYLQSNKNGKEYLEAISFCKASEGKLHVWTNLIDGRPDQSKQYIFGIDTSKGQGASESVISIKCKEDGRKIARWSCANTPPYEFARIVVAVALWCGGTNPRNLPFLKWEKNGPGWDLGRILVETFKYPYYYSYKRSGQTGGQSSKDLERYGWHNSPQSKYELLALYNRLLAHGGYINPDKKGLEQAKLYIDFPGGGCGPSELVYESSSARLLHGDIVMADALTLEDTRLPKSKHDGVTAPYHSFAFRKKKFMRKRKNKNKKTWRQELILDAN